MSYEEVEKFVKCEMMGVDWFDIDYLDDVIDIVWNRVDEDTPYEELDDILRKGLEDLGFTEEYFLEAEEIEEDHSGDEE